MSSSNLKASIREEMRKKLNKEFENKNAALIESVTNYKTLLIKEQNRNKTLREANAKIWQENEDLKMQVAALEDQNRRLLEYMDMPEEDREKAIEEYKTALKNNEALNGMMKFVTKTLSLFT